MPYEKLVEKYQCPGCVCGSNTKCGKFKQDRTGQDYGCTSQVIGTTVFGIGHIALGLPRGFNRTGEGKLVLRIIEEHKTHYDKFNIPVWYMRKDAETLVRCYSPRTNATYIDIIPGIPKMPECSIDMTNSVNNEEID